MQDFSARFDPTLQDDERTQRLLNKLTLIQIEYKAYVTEMTILLEKALKPFPAKKKLDRFIEAMALLFGLVCATSHPEIPKVSRTSLLERSIPQFMSA